METRASYILVGLFTLVSGVAVLLFTLWITGAGAERQVTLFDVLFREPVSGLSIGSPVQYSGIRVGEVSELSFDPVDPRIVRARIEVSSDVPVRVDTVAQLTLLNITGASAIELGGGSPESPNLTNGDDVAVIEATPSSLTQLRITSEELIVSASTLLERANQLFAEDNTERVSRVLENVEMVTGSLAEQQAALQESLEQLTQSGRSLDALLTNANQQLTRYEQPILAGVADSVAELQRTSSQMSLMLERNEPAFSAGMQGFAELAPAMRELRNILRNVDSLTRRLSENPTDFVLGNDTVREYQP